MTTADARPAVRRLADARGLAIAPGVRAAALLDDRHGCRGLHQRRISAGASTEVTGRAAGFGESWYVIAGLGTLDAGQAGQVGLRPGTAVWMRRGTWYTCRAGGGLEILVTCVRSGSLADDTGPALRVVSIDDCEPERTGDREFRVLLTTSQQGRLAITQFAGTIPPGRAPEHHHSYDEVVHVLSGVGVVHLGGTDAPIGPGTSVYLPPAQPHCLENTGAEPLRVLGVFYPAGSPAAKRQAPAAEAG